MERTIRTDIAYLFYEIADIKRLLEESSKLANYMTGLVYVPGTDRNDASIIAQQTLPPKRGTADGTS